MVLKESDMVGEIAREFTALSVLDGEAKPNGRANPVPRPHVGLAVVVPPKDNEKGTFVLRCVLCEGRCIGGLSRRNCLSSKQAHNATRWIAHLVERCEACPWEVKMALWRSSNSETLQKPKRTAKGEHLETTSPLRGAPGKTMNKKAATNQPVGTDTEEKIISLFRDACERNFRRAGDGGSPSRCAADELDLHKAALFIANATKRRIPDVKALVDEADVDDAKCIDEDKLVYVIRQLCVSG
ncbi:hypothetical protein FVE85_2160 [Porphyridium purpureum]|uniref:Uncharacterized protein n=1 Tax=Porphyridium purpureum TaxID=35688 RepID=A0A5J4YXW6_PORPP|nr:hypothetical protein FVE85_2160 [Porphyridium purpureum]|eukprot:POR4879..scf209_3